MEMNQNRASLRFMTRIFSVTEYQFRCVTGSYFCTEDLYSSLENQAENGLNGTQRLKFTVLIGEKQLRSTLRQPNQLGS